MQGSGGGPSEDNVTGFLVRSMASEWSKGSILAVDAGSHLAAITRILEQDFPLVSGSTHAAVIGFEDMPSPGGDAKSEDDSSDSNCDRSLSPEIPSKTLEAGPFTGLTLPHASARANAVHFVREHVSTYLITHPHLDHLSGFAINTAAFHNTSRPKRLAALPFTVNAIKTHIFNDIIWPNLTDEDNGVGLVTFQRLTEGGNLALGEGISRGFIEVCDGLAVKGFKVSHGNCASNPRTEVNLRRNSNPQSGGNHQIGHPVHTHNHPAPQHNPGEKGTPGDGGRRSSIFSQPSQPGTPTFYSGQQEYVHTVVDSTAFFIRADATGKEILIFGDVEPDSLSVCPRTHIVWAEAAPKISHHLLTGIFIECSYNDSQKDAVLFGHLSPRHLIAELQALAEMVAEKKRESAEKVGRKRKRASTALGTSTADDTPASLRSRSRTKRASTPKLGNLEDSPMGDVHEKDYPAPVTPTTALFTKESHALRHHHHHHHQNNGDTSTSTPHLQSILTRNSTADGTDASLAIGLPYEPPLKGVRIIIIHVKDSMLDGPLVGESILRELNAHEQRLEKQGRALGCTFEVSASGDSFWF
jgi:cAMP phosphodiesterase